MLSSKHRYCVHLNRARRIDKHQLFDSRNWLISINENNCLEEIMLADSLRIRVPKLRYVEPLRVQRPTRSWLPNVRSVVRDYRKIRVPAHHLSRARVPIHHAYVPYSPVAISGVAQTSYDISITNLSWKKI